MRFSELLRAVMRPHFFWLCFGLASVALLDTFHFLSAIAQDNAPRDLSVISQQPKKDDLQSHFFSELNCESCVLFHLDDGIVLQGFEQNSPVLASGSTKLMVTLLVLEAVKNGTLNPDTEILIDEDIWRAGGAPSGLETMFAAVNKRYQARELLDGLIVANGADAALALMLHVFEDHTRAIEAMKARANQLGLTATAYHDIPGVDPNNRTSARDLALIAREIYKLSPSLPQDLQTIFLTPDIRFSSINQRNKNRLLHFERENSGIQNYAANSVLGYAVYGQKQTPLLQFVIGFESPFGPIVLVAMNTPEHVSLAKHKVSAVQLIARIIKNLGQDYTYRTFFEKHYDKSFMDHKGLYSFPVTGCDVSLVAGGLKQPVRVLLPQTADDTDVSFTLRANIPLLAPVAQGARVGTLDVSYQNNVLQSRDVFALNNCPTGGFWTRVRTGIRALWYHLLFPDKAVKLESP